MSDWLSYWDGDTSIYVNARHLDAHYQRLSADLGALLPKPPFTLLDYGCGEALMAPRLAASGGRILLYDAAKARQKALAKRFAGSADIDVLDDEALLALRGASCDMIVMISVLQYLDSDHLLGLFTRLAGLLAPRGRLVIGDIIPPDCSMLADIGSLLGFAAKNGFFIAALLGLVKTFHSDYRRLRKDLGLATYTPLQIETVLAQAGLKAMPLDHNIGHSRTRYSVVAVNA